MRVLPTTVFETHSSAAVANTLVGSKVTLGGDAASVTATTEGGVFTVDWTDGAGAGGRVRGISNEKKEREITWQASSFQKAPA